MTTTTLLQRFTLATSAHTAESRSAPRLDSASSYATAVDALLAAEPAALADAAPSPPGIAQGLFGRAMPNRKAGILDLDTQLPPRRPAGRPRPQRPLVTNAIESPLVLS